MVVVSFNQTGRSIEVPEGTTILQAARQAGIIIESPCNSAGTCAKCAVRVDLALLANIVHKGRHRLSADEESQGFVLSCEAEVVGDVAVHILPREQHKTLKILSHGVGGEVELNPFISKSYDAEADVTRVYGGVTKLAMEAGDTRQALYGIVVDIGTTTLAAGLVDLATGTEIGRAGALNPQSHHAQDVLSRIRFGSTEDGLQTMHAALIQEIGHLIDRLAGEVRIDPQSVYEIVFSGNTCMLHLAMRENPASLGKHPYTPQLRGGEHRAASGFHLPIAASALIYLPPIISAYVGADITSGILATGLHRHTGVTLLVDIGTNGEMVIAGNGRLCATSTAAGPAFEGMNISCGMRASNGAIEAFTIDQDGALTVNTIGDVEAVGICGSGLMDIVAELVASGVITANGRFCAPEGIPGSLRERMVKRDGKPAFCITEKIFLSQKDIRQVQLAKGAVRAGIEFLLAKLDIEAECVERVLIAGSFGHHLRVESLIAIGLLPPQFAGKIEFVGNTSKSGGEAFLLNRFAREEMVAVVKGVEVVELADFPDFDKCFVQCLNFP